MIIGERIRSVRKEKQLSQGDLERRTGLLRCYLSRVENGHTIPSLETLEKIARALEMRVYQLLYEGEGPPRDLAVQTGSGEYLWGSHGKDGRYLQKLRGLLSQAQEKDRRLLLHVAAQMVKLKRRRAVAVPN